MGPGWVSVGPPTLLAKTELGASLDSSVHTMLAVPSCQGWEEVDDVSMVNRGMAAAGPVWGLGGCQ